MLMPDLPDETAPEAQSQPKKQGENVIEITTNRYPVKNVNFNHKDAVELDVPENAVQPVAFKLNF